jgi:hypothetical protein
VKHLSSNKKTSEMNNKTTILIAAMMLLMGVLQAKQIEVKWPGAGRSASHNFRSALAAAVPGDTVTFMKKDGEWLLGGINIQNNNITILMKPGVQIRINPGEYYPRLRMFNLKEEAHNNSIIGEGEGDQVPSLSGNLEEDAQSHLINSASDTIDGLTVRNLVLKKAGGDGMLLGDYSKSVNNLLVEDVIFEDNRRQGISMAHVRDAVVRNCIFRNTRGTWPMSGIDLETHNNDEMLVNILIENCVFEDNMGAGVQVNLWGTRKVMKEKLQVNVNNCTFKHNELSAVRIAWIPPSVWKEDDIIQFNHCTFSGNGWGSTNDRYRANNDVFVLDKSADLNIEFNDCTFTECANYPFLFRVLDDNWKDANLKTGTTGGIALNNVEIRYKKDKAPMVFENSSSEALNIEKLTGNATYYAPEDWTISYSGAFGTKNIGLVVKHIETTVGIKEKKFGATKVYPNPIGDFLHLKDGLAYEYARIFDYTGRSLLQTAISNQTIDVSTLKAGTYLLQLEGKQRFVTRFVKL